MRAINPCRASTAKGTVPLLMQSSTRICKALKPPKFSGNSKKPFHNWRQQHIKDIKTQISKNHPKLLKKQITSLANKELKKQWANLTNEEKAVY